MNVMIRFMYELMMEGGLLMEESCPMYLLSGVNVLHIGGGMGAGSRQNCTLKSRLLLVNFYFVLSQFQIK